MSFAKCLVLALSVVASVNALTTPHAARHSIHHRSLAARVVEPRSANLPVSVLSARAPRRRCRPRASSSSSAPSSTSTPDVTVPPINAAPIPTNTREQSSTSTKTATTSRVESSTTKTTTTTKKPTPTNSDDDNNSGGGGGGAPNGFLAGTQHGDGTFYDTGLGACGETSKDTDFIVAVSQHLFDSYPGATANPNKNPVCGKKIRASRGGKSVIVKAIDRCGGCAMTDLDFSPAAFDALTGGNRGLGRIKIDWVWA